MVYTWQISTYYYRNSVQCGQCHCSDPNCCDNQVNPGLGAGCYHSWHPYIGSYDWRCC